MCFLSSFFLDFFRSCRRLFCRMDNFAHLGVASDANVRERCGNREETTTLYPFHLFLYAFRSVWLKRHSRASFGAKSVMLACPFRRQKALDLVAWLANCGPWSSVIISRVLIVGIDLKVRVLWAPLITLLHLIRLFGLCRLLSLHDWRLFFRYSHLWPRQFFDFNLLLYNWHPLGSARYKSLHSLTAHRNIGLNRLHQIKI